MSGSSTGRALHDPARLEALDRSGLLDAPQEPAFDRLTRMVKRVLGVPIALVTLVDRHRQFFLSSDGLPEDWTRRRETPLSHSFCQHVVGTGNPFRVDDANAEILVRDSLARSELGVVAYLGMPMRSPDGYTLGALCAIDVEPRRWSEEDEAALADLAGIAETEIALRAATVRLEEQVEREVAARVALQNELLQKSRLEALGQVAGGVAHDFGNLLQSVQAGVRLTKKHLEADPARALEMLDMVADSARRGSAITRRLLGFARRGEARVSPIAPAEVLNELTPMLRYMLDRPGLQFTLDAPGDLPRVLADRGELETVLLNLVSNARDALVDGGTVAIRAYVLESAPEHCAHGRPMVAFSITDDGIGMDEDTLARAAEAFFTTKPEGQGTGLGLSMARDFATHAGGGFQIESTIGVGTAVTLWLPASES